MFDFWIVLISILAYTSLIHGAEISITAESKPCYQPEILHDKVNVKKHLALHPNVVSFSKNLFLFGEGKYGSTEIRSRQGNTLEKVFSGYQPGRVRALEDNTIYWFEYEEVPRIHYYDSKSNQKGVFALSALINNQERISRIKLSKTNPNYLYVFSHKYNQISGVLGYEQFLYLNLIDLTNGNTLKRVCFKPEFKMFEKEDCPTDIHLVETAQEKQIVLYRRTGGEELAWHFDAKQFEIVKTLPFDRMESCKANNSGLVVFAHNHNTISVVKTDDLSSVLYTINMIEQWPQKMYFLSNDHLLVASHGQYCDYCFKNKLEHVKQNALSIFDLENKSCIYREKSSRDFSRIKPEYDENGNVKKNTALLYHMDGVSSAWHALTYNS